MIAAFLALQIAVVPEGAFDSEIVVAPDGTAAAVIEREGGRCRAIVGDEPGEWYDLVWGPTFGADGRRWACWARRDGDTYMVENGKPSKAYEAVGGPVFAPAGDRLAYKVKQKGRWHVVADGKIGPPFDWVGDPLFSADGRNVAYVGRTGVEERVVENGKKGASYQWVRDLMYAAGAGVTAYFAFRSDQGWRIVVGGAERVARKGRPTSLAISRDGKRVSYVAEEGLIVAGEPVAASGTPYFGPDAGLAALLEDGSRVRWPGGKTSVVENLFSGDSVLSPDGTRFAVISHEGGKYVLRVNGETVREADAAPQPTFSANGATLAFALKTGGSWTVVAGAAETAETFDWVGPLHFSADGKRVSFGARIARELFWKTLEVK